MFKPFHGIAVAGVCALALLAGCSAEADPAVETPTVSETVEVPTQDTQPEETVTESTEPEPSEEPSETVEPEPSVEESTAGSDAPAAEGNWVHEEVDGVPSATVTTAGASLTFQNDPVTGTTAILRADQFTTDYVNTVLCTEMGGCGRANFNLDGATSEHMFSRPDASDGDVRISFRQPRDLWSFVSGADGVLQVVLVEKATDAEVVFEFDITGVDPDFI